MFIEGTEDLGHAPHEHPGVPVVPAGGDHLLRHVALRLLDEALHGVHRERRPQVEAIPRFDVAESGVGALRLDAERHELPRLGRGGRGDQHLAELPAPLDDVVRGQDRDDGLRIERVQRGHRESDRRGVAARVRLDDHVVRAQLGQLLVDEEAVLRWRDGEDALERDDLDDTIDGVLEKRALTGERKELLRLVAPRERPEPRARTAREDQRVEARQRA